MKKSILILVFSSSLLFSCKQDNNLVEVQIPEPEVIIESKFAIPQDFKAVGSPFKLFPITYTFEQFPDFIDGKTFEFHYGRIYLSYANNLNSLVKNTDWNSKTISQICSEASQEEDKAILKNGGGFYNHTLFFENLTPKKGKKPSDELKLAIEESFISFDEFKKSFEKEALAQSGSNWVWLIVNVDKKLEIVTTSNENNPLMKNAPKKGKPILCLDIWEHAYLLNSKHSKQNYIEHFFNYIDWENVSEIYKSIQQ